ncbi:hypothetical protein R69619_00474 [Paraburkholderia nemoris]|uniref:hypothetical protein n=1 Tax=Paraburkholderia nemoris TaxID=2793076 RepID=UPI00190BB452|nr:hypothetical protein [Paraburkholderia nemoris]MBK3737737.1 hypothetical protein [Paraburkholderia aspalathi]CAE6695831.1 hypothetical protein R69619_00474 [Paraburkholderia nemoris]
MSQEKMPNRASRNGSRRTPTRRPASIAEALRAALPPVASGLMCFVIRDPILMPYVRAEMQFHLCAGTPIADVPVLAAEKLVALYASGSHDASIAEVLARGNLKAPSRADQIQVGRLPDCRVFDPSSNEGVHVTLSHLQVHGCVTAEQRIAGTHHDQMIDAYGRLDAGSRARNGLVALFVCCPLNTDLTLIRQLCDAVFVVDKCEPGPGASVAFAVTALSLESQYANGIGRTMYEISYQGSDWSSTTSVFIAAKAEDRAIWYARREGDYLETIGDWMGGADKSTVKRRQDLAALHPHTDVDITPPVDWRDDWFPFLGWNETSDGTGEGAEDGDEDEGDDVLHKTRKRVA